MKNKIIYGCAILLGSTLLLSAISKAVNLVEFRSVTHKFVEDPFWLANLLPVLVVGLEFSLGIFLVMLRYLREAALISVLLLSFFITITVLNRPAAEKASSCGCFATKQLTATLPFGWIIARDFGLLGLAVVVFISQSSRKEGHVIEMEPVAT